MERGTTFAEAYPDRIADWSDENDDTPWDVTHKSRLKRKWVCGKGHTFTCAVGDVATGVGCGVCSGRQVVAGVNDLQTHHPGLAKQWMTDKNDIHPSQVSRGSGRRGWWQCDLLHEWRATVSDRAGGRGCPFCTGRRILPGYNDLATLNPEALTFWDFSRNDEDPSNVAPGSHKKVWWMGGCGHSWFAPIRHVAQKGYGCSVCAGRLGGHEHNNLKTVHPHLAGEWHPTRNDRNPEDVTHSSGYEAWWLCEKGHEFQVRVNQRAHFQTGCAACSRVSESKPEADLAAFVESLGLEVIRNDRKVLKGLELDIIVPEKNVAIEFNGLYWHSEKHKSNTFHKDKSVLAEEAGVTLIHVWEDDWRDAQETVKKMVAVKLGKSNQERVNARSLKVETVTAAEAKEFLNKNHIQGFASGSLYLALKDEQVRALVVMKAASEDGTYRLERYATSANVRGGFSRLLKNAVKLLDAKKVVTFADRGVSDGGLYLDNGFTRDGEIEPDYRYIVKGRREHKFNYRKGRFDRDPALKFEEGLTERQLASLNGLDRIYDAGKVRWVLTV